MKQLPLRGTVNYERRQPEMAKFRPAPITEPNDARNAERSMNQGVVRPSNPQQLQKAEPFCKSLSGEETNKPFCWKRSQYRRKEANIVGKEAKRRKQWQVFRFFVFYWAYRLYQEWYNGENQSEW